MIVLLGLFLGLLYFVIISTMAYRKLKRDLEQQAKLRRRFPLPYSVN